MDPPEPPECSQCGKEITEEPDLNCEICFATLCSDPKCSSQHTEENHLLRGFKEAITSSEGEGSVDDPIKVSVSATQKVNVGSYESVDVFFALSNIPVGATDEDLAAAMATSELAFTHVKAKVIQEVASIRRKMEQ